MGRAPHGAEFPSGTQPNSFPSGSFEKVPFGQPSSMESARDKRLKAPMGEHLSPLPVPHDQGHSRFGEPTCFGPFAGRAYMGELSAFGDIPGFGESSDANKPGMPRFWEPGFRSRYPVLGYPNHGFYAVDCETVEGLDIHSQTREHQDMAMDMTFSDRASAEEKSKTRKAVFEGHGRKT
ncbi:hypothetical protein HAX54_001777 [Datura stramonium]|uniref:Uncharacterized protein n=1 Tax=Datura stramonium TaxID=4076 RepID=A0ABS8T4Z8_DATST|nr:hypothetical protein [Datura stramonium]